MDELEQERQRQLRLKALAEESGAAIGPDEMRRASGLAPEQRIEADPSVRERLMAYAMPSIAPSPSPTPRPTPSPQEESILQSIYGMFGGGPKAPAAPTSGPGLYNFRPDAADEISERFGGKKRKK